MRILLFTSFILVLTGCNNEQSPRIDPLPSTTPNPTIDPYGVFRSSFTRLVTEQPTCTWYLSGESLENEAQQTELNRKFMDITPQFEACWSSAQDMGDEISELRMRIQPLMGYGYLESEVNVISFNADKSLLYTLYGESMHRSSNVPTNAIISYRTDLRMILAPGYNINQEWFCALLLHESLHAEQHLMGEDLVNMDSVYKNEVEAHIVERDALIHLSNGEYLSALDVVISEDTTSNSVKEFIQRLGYEDLKTVNDVFSTGCQYEVAHRLGQFVFDLGDRWLNSRGITSAEDRIELYSLLRETFAV